MSGVVEFLQMGGYAEYVWGAYGITLVVLIWNFCAPALKRRRLERLIRRGFEGDRA